MLSLLTANIRFKQEYISTTGIDGHWLCVGIHLVCCACKEKLERDCGKRLVRHVDWTGRMQRIV